MHTRDRWSTQRVCLWWRRLWGPLQHHKAQRSHVLSWANQTFSLRTSLAYWSCSRSSSTAPFLSPYLSLSITILLHTSISSTTMILSYYLYHTNKTIPTRISIINTIEGRSTLQFLSIDVFSPMLLSWWFFFLCVYRMNSMIYNML